MKSCNLTLLDQATTLHTYADPHFKTMRLSVNLFLPLSSATAAIYGILPGIVTRATREYPTFSQLSQKLSGLYGASLSTSVRKMGTYQVLRLSASGIAERYAFAGDPITKELTQLLLSALFTPLMTSDGLFPAEHVQQEKRQLLELKAAEYSDKIAYARQQCERLVFEGTPAALDRYGDIDEIKAIAEQNLPSAWREILSKARFEIFSLGDTSVTPEHLQPHFQGVGTSHSLRKIELQKPASVLRKTEEQPLAQSKLSMGFRVHTGQGERLLFQLMSAVLGGVPSSKLFRNVREKMSLCYYCSSSYHYVTRSLFIDSGVETADLPQAEEAILEQLALLQQGQLTAEELLSAKLALCNSLRSVSDSLGAVESWNLGQLFEETPFTPEEAVQRLMDYTAEDVIEAARAVELCAVFILKGTEVHD